MNILTILMPVYNEGKGIANTIRKYHKVISSTMPCDVVICEDGSTDDTKQVLLKLQQEMPIKLYLGDERKGYQKAARDALCVAETPLVFMVDSDGQYLPDDFLVGIKFIQEYDIVIGRRIRSKESIHRRILRSGFNFLLRPLFHIPIHDVDCGYKIIKKEVIDSVINDVTGYLPYSFNAEFMIRAFHRGFKVKEFEIKHVEREFGQTTVYPLGKIPKIVFLQLVGLVRLKIALSKQK